jgi:hypothetical protein
LSGSACASSRSPPLGDLGVFLGSVDDHIGQGRLNVSTPNCVCQSDVPFIDLGALARVCDNHIGDRHQRFDGGVEGEPHHIITAGVDNQPVELDVAVAEVLIGYGLVPLDSKFGGEPIRELGVLRDGSYGSRSPPALYAICVVAMTLENAAQSSDLSEPALTPIFDAHRSS